MIKKFYQKIKAGIYAILIFVLVYYVYNYFDILIDAVQSHYVLLLILSALSMVAIFLQASNYLDMLEYEREISLYGVYKMWAHANLVNYLAPFQPGLIIRALYFKKYEINYLDTGITSLRQCYISLVIGLLFLAILVPSSTSILLVIKLLLIVSFILGVLFFYIDISPVLKLVPLPNLELYSSRVLVVPTCKQLTMIVLQYLIIGFAYYLMFMEFGHNLSIGNALLLSSSTILTTLFSIFPNGVGIQEVIVGSMAYYLSPESAIFVAIPFILRTSHIISCLLILVLVTLCCLIANTAKKNK